MSYLDLLKLAAPEAIVTLTALIVLVIGLRTSRGTVVAGVSPAMPQRRAIDTTASTVVCSFVVALGLIVAIGAVVSLSSNGNLFLVMLVIVSFNSIFLV